MKATVVAALGLLIGVCRASHPKPSCRYPPSEWCRSLEIATACRVQKQCMEMNAIRQYPPAPKVNVSLYYESLCPFSIHFLTQKLLPTYLLLADIMEVHLVPYGNAQETTSDNAPFSCQHGIRECRLNMITACALHYLRNTAFKFLFVECLESSINKLEDAAYCYKVFSFYTPWEKVMDCVDGPEGITLMRKYADETRALRPEHTYVPWITINGEHREDTTDLVETSLFLLVCNLYKGVKPGVCTGVPAQLNRGYSFT